LANTVGDNFKLRDGAISRSILERAGAEIQQELDSLKPQSASSAGDVVVTKGHRLSASYVLHGVLKKWTNGQDDAVSIEWRYINVAEFMQACNNDRRSWYDHRALFMAGRCNDSAPDKCGRFDCQPLAATQRVWASGSQTHGPVLQISINNFIPAKGQ